MKRLLLSLVFLLLAVVALAGCEEPASQKAIRVEWDAEQSKRLRECADACRSTGALLASHDRDGWGVWLCKCVAPSPSGLTLKVDDARGAR